MNRKHVLFALSAVFLLIAVATLYSVVSTPKPDGPPETEPEEFTPRLVTAGGANVDLTHIPGAPSNEPDVAINPTDNMNIIAASNDYGTPNGDAWVGYYWSKDGGVTWGRGLVPGYRGDTQPSPLLGFHGAGDPVLCFDGEGSAYLAGIGFQRTGTPGGVVGRATSIFVAKSTDGGETFPQVTMVAQSLTFGTFHDKEWMACDQKNGNVYITWTVFSALVASNIVFSRSTDGGVSFSRPPTVVTEIPFTEYGVQGSALKVDLEGTIHVVWGEYNENKVRYAKSMDQGGSWSSPKDISDMIAVGTLPNTGYRTPSNMAFAIDKSGGQYDGSLYAIWDDYRNGDADILMVYSRDKGESWSEPVRVNNDPPENGADQFFGVVSVSSQGYVHSIFYDRRDDENNTLLHMYYALSKDGGQNFTLNMNITTESFDGNDSPGPFMGDYIGMDTNDTWAVGVWCDTRDASEGTPETEIYFARVQFALNGNLPDELPADEEEE